MGRIAFLLLALFAEMERTFTAERAAHADRVELINLGGRRDDGADGGDCEDWLGQDAGG